MWMKDNQAITSHRIVSGQNQNQSFLKINKVERGDIGKYSLIASNLVGEAKSTAVLAVTGE